MLRHIQTSEHIRRAPNLWTELTCLQCMNICCIFVGDISFEVKTEADSNDITQYSHDDIPSTGMIILHYECILPRYFDVYYVHQQIYVCLELKVKVLLESHP